MIGALFDIAGLVPHGVCLAWRPSLFWTLAVADGIIALSYLSISAAITLYLVKRADMYLRGVAMAFAAFILLCASSHFSDLWTLWVPDYGVQAVIKVLTAVVSLITAVLLWPLLPHALALPTSAQLMAANQALEAEVAERRAAEAMLRGREAELRAANAELDSFAYAVSHDLRAPLRAMSGFCAALKEDHGADLSAEALSYLDEIAHAGRHMGALIDGILTLSRATRGEFQREEVDISAIAHGVVAELHRAEPHRQIACDIQPNLTAWGDPRMLEQVLRNLLENAWKYTSVSAAPRIGVSGGRNAVTVSDSGAGFDMAYADKLFQPFQRLHRQDEFPGIGIGLSTVARIVHRHGGRITAEAALGKGATFHVTVPGPEGIIPPPG